MRGFRKIHSSGPRPGVIAAAGVAILFLLIAAGCGGADNIYQTERKRSSIEEFLGQYESTFDPARYAPRIDSIRRDVEQERATLESASVVSIAAPETIPGFRVQALFTGDIDQANHTKDTLTTLLPDDWVYLVYEAPYYRVRVGNYTERTAANQMVKKLVSLGYSDAWVVRDNIIKNPPPKIPDTFIEPERPLDGHR